jgi:hypothetical protein
MSLDEIQASLHEHFKLLHASRETNAVFALEHNLTDKELAELGRGIRKQIGLGGPLERHWLAWALYSCEIGYDYSGEEYWQTFADRTPGWAVYGDRDFIRTVFKRFHKELGGPYPEGRWAEAFRIICWPITNSILPKDLQRELAEILYDLRDHYTFDLLQSPRALGEKIDAFSWRANSRFQGFADQHELVGQIATALLRHTKDSDSNFILPRTLQRIVVDLEKERQAREWLSSAQSSAARLAVRGLTRSGQDYEEDYEEEGFESEEDLERRETVVDLGIEPEPSIVRIEKNSWEVRLRLPDLSRLLGRFPQFKRVLTGERCTVAGAKGAPLPRGFLLYGFQQVVLSQWPDSSEVLLKFDNSVDELDFLLKTECLLRPGPRWLFKVLEDGTAMEVKGRVMRPGNSYIVLSRGGSAERTPSMHKVQLDIKCEGISGVMVEVPETISGVYRDQVRRLGFHSAGTLRVQPVGLAAANWDNEGSAEWLTSDNPLIAISADHELQGMILNLVGPAGSQLQIPDQAIASTVFVELGELLPGRYKLYVITRVSGYHGPDVSGILNFGIRHPRAAQSGHTASSPFRVLVSPATPSLEQLWSGEAKVEIQGPKGRKAKAKLEFFLDERQTPKMVERYLPPLDLPCASDGWRDGLESIQGDTRVQNACSEASRCRVHIDCQELGTFSLDCPREFCPVRWILKYENNGYYLRLAQYESLNVNVSYFDYENPTSISKLDIPVDDGFRVPPEGGLYVAETADFLSSVFVSGQITSLSDLDHKVAPSSSISMDADLKQFLTILKAWATAKTPGDPISRMRKKRVVGLLRERLLSHLCGGDWARMEQRLLESPSVLWDLRLVLSAKARYGDLGAELFDQHSTLSAMSIQALSTFLASFVHDNLDLPLFAKQGSTKSNSQSWVMEFALRLMSLPEEVSEWAKADFVPAVAYLKRHSILFRISRYVFLLRSAQFIPKVRRLEGEVR